MPAKLSQADTVLEFQSADSIVFVRRALSSSRCCQSSVHRLRGGEQVLWFMCLCTGQRLAAVWSEDKIRRSSGSHTANRQLLIQNDSESRNSSTKLKPGNDTER